MLCLFHKDDLDLEHDIFLCHNSLDKPWVQKLAESIEDEDYDNRKLKVFYDDWDIIPGENLVLKIEYAQVDSLDYLIDEVPMHPSRILSFNSF